ncbi:transcriptional regulator, MarR family [Desulfovibrio sp. X2]|uniref:MarR family winged helix-turn-helix transcriptional regulator n=1 Tax=Desulfovibrio sp. X2 TaxID=941449 RepID=UPI00035897B1|nr:MarR family transcriptional regulator [Desulfovibrio sp. X2]EPR36354.1 transcriptional regulator, MarR family [Desulfovibrio sp. X2]
MLDDVSRCARELLDLTPEIMRLLRAEMRGNRTPDLSVPQFRVLIYLRRHPGSNLREAGEFMGLSAPAMSKIVDGLTQRGMVERAQCSEDRRRVTLELTPAGLAVLDAAREATTAIFAGRLSLLGQEQLAVVLEALQILRSAFAAAPQNAAENPATSPAHPQEPFHA